MRYHVTVQFNHREPMYYSTWDRQEANKFAAYYRQPGRRRTLGVKKVSCAVTSGNVQTSSINS